MDIGYLISHLYTPLELIRWLGLFILGYGLKRLIESEETKLKRTIRKHHNLNHTENLRVCVDGNCAIISKKQGSYQPTHPEIVASVSAEQVLDQEQSSL
jgi:hypothetical protein